MFRRWRFWLLLVLFQVTATAAAAKTQIDRTAGIKFTVPFKSARVVRGVAVEPPLQKSVPPPPEPVVSTAIYSPQNLPALTVTVYGAQGRLTRQLVHSLSPDASDHGRAAWAAWLGGDTHGINNIEFDKSLLRGTADLPAEQGVKTKVLLQLVRDRVTVLRYAYKTAKDLEGWTVVTSSLKVGRLSQLNYSELPDGAPRVALQWVAGILALLAFGLVLSGVAWVAYRRMAKGPDIEPGLGPVAPGIN